jgi:hypothetical protein
MGYTINHAAVRELRDRVRYNVEQAGLDLALAINNAIQTPGPPRSQPGDPPHVDKHRLHGSYETAMHPSEPIVYVGSEVPYAAALETGTNQGLEARPHIVSTLMAERTNLAYKIGTTP